MAEAIVISERVRVPGNAIELRAVRASGPGGQNVNKVSSKVELRVDLELIEGLDVPARVRLLGLIRTTVDAEGKLLVTSQKTRDQLQNLEDARQKVRSYIERAMVVPKPRRATKPTRGSVERRITDKKKSATNKAQRRGGWD